jgi:hypothetical protein
MPSAWGPAKTWAQRRWRDAIEARALARLQHARVIKVWDGTLPIPTERVLERALDLRIRWDGIEEDGDEAVFAAFEADTKSVVLNDRYEDHFAAQPGHFAFTLGHEAGHADVFALAALASQGTLAGDLAWLQRQYQPRRRSTRSGSTVAVLAAAMKRRLEATGRALTPEQTFGMYARFLDEERKHQAAGEDTPLERRACNIYAATLLMPPDLLRTYAREIDVTDTRQVLALAEQFGVSHSAMRIQLCDLELAYNGGDGPLLDRDPRQRGQGDLFA